MKRDIIGDIFLGGVLLSLLFLFSFPAYFCYSQNVPRDISLMERMMSVCFLLAMILTIIWACWKKKVWVMLGICAFGILAYLPKWYLPKLDAKLAKPGKNIVDTLLSSFLNRIYELVHAPFTGLIGMFSEKQAEKLPYLILPVVVIAYVLSQIVRFYRNAYIAEKKQIHDFDRFRKLNEVRSPVMPFATEGCSRVLPGKKTGERPDRHEYYCGFRYTGTSFRRAADGGDRPGGTGTELPPGRRDPGHCSGSAGADFPSCG